MSPYTSNLAVSRYRKPLNYLRGLRVSLETTIILPVGKTSFLVNDPFGLPTCHILRIFYTHHIIGSQIATILLLMFYANIFGLVFAYQRTVVIKIN